MSVGCFGVGEIFLDLGIVNLDLTSPSLNIKIPRFQCGTLDLGQTSAAEAVEDFTLHSWRFVFSVLSRSILLLVFQAGSCFIFSTYIFLLSDNKIAASSSSAAGSRNILTLKAYVRKSV